MKINNKGNEYPQAVKIFTDREEPRKAFWDAYYNYSAVLSKNEFVKVLTYYGIGGIGKSTLFSQLQIELKEKIKNPKFVFIDLEHVKTVRLILESIRNNLSEKYGFRFPMFDLALYIYAKKLGEAVSVEQIQTLISRSPILEEIFNIAGDIPVIGLFTKLTSLADKGIATLRNVINNRDRRSEIIELEQVKNTPDAILNKLPYYLALDLTCIHENATEPLVIFLDTYESYVNELSGFGEPLIIDEWLRNEKYGLVTNAAGVLWVIAGREKIKWSMFNTDWDESLEQHRLGDLSEKDANFFLHSAGISDQNLQHEIYELTNGTPIYLDLCVERYYSLQNNGKIPTINDIGKNKTELIERFVRYMDDSKKDIIYLLSCLKSWTTEMLVTIAELVLPSYSISALDKIKGYSFIVSVDDIQYTIHETVRNILYSSCPSIIKDKVSLFLPKYYHNILNGMLPIQPEFEMAIINYIQFSLINISTQVEFEKFYDEIQKFLEELKQTGQCKAYRDAMNSLKEFSERQFGECKTTAHVLLDYSQEKLLDDNTIAIELAQKVYNMFNSLYGMYHFNTLLAMNNLSCCYNSAGMYKEALDLSIQLLDISKNVLKDESLIFMAEYNLESNRKKINRQYRFMLGKFNTE